MRTHVSRRYAWLMAVAMATAMGIDLAGWSFGAQFGDLNNDGLLDLYVVNGYVSADKNESYWYDYSKVAGGNQLVISDAKNWPPMAGLPLDANVPFLTVMATKMPYVGRG